VKALIIVSDNIDNFDLLAHLWVVSCSDGRCDKDSIRACKWPVYWTVLHIEKINDGMTNSYFRNAIVQRFELGRNHCSTKARATVANGTVAFSHT
jgi:hypothetical protein